ncbi:unnamed protein product [Rotaria socialis]|uniref:Uncharacterized protein n=1 Tax=Rotaria socialis TaxID=392032 RepID=A0A820PIU3_9BILA|nr:unnamed protein product [Rotaria socialis]CAF3308960.1 unnamed protein product [Rotaria socialis]CAF3324656.1 unnamed protein product [Rotaria socialis]CAF3327448.1 unnamed protein product [Rotaria socialis]CAF3504019.1 unnamed protein product [Rotaria socialis]
MATNDDLDDFFKKKDRKGNKHKKPAGLLTNNEELLKQLVIVTSATSAFKENMDFDDDEEEEASVNNQNRRPIVEESNGIIHDGNHTAVNKTQTNSTSINKTKNSTKLTVQDNHNNINEQQQQPASGQQDEWEEFENSNPKYDKLRLKFSRGTNDQIHSDEDKDDDYYDDDGHNTNNHALNTNDNTNNIGDDNDEQAARNNRRREQLKDKPVWKLDQVKQAEPIQTIEVNNSTADKVAELPPSTSATPNVYRPPQLRGNASVTVVSGVNQRPSKKEKPNLASNEDFPTLGAAVNKK